MKKWYRANTPSGPYWTPDPPASHRYLYPDLFSDEGKFANPDKIQDTYRKLIDKDPGVEIMRDSGGLVFQTYSAKSNLPEEVPPGGYYRFMKGSYSTPERLKAAQVRQGEDPVVMSEGVFQSVRHDITRFAESRPLYEQVGAHYHMGILMYGPPGNGKSTLIRQVLGDLPVLKDAIKITCSSELPSPSFLESLSSLPALKILIFEELYWAIKEEGKLTRMLNFLDGEDSVSGAIVLATTNCPELLPGNIVDRPSRFDKLYRFGSPNGAERAALLTKILSRPPTNGEVHATRGFSAAYVREAAIKSVIDKISVEQASQELRARMREIKKDFSQRSPIGLNKDDEA